MFPSKFNRPAHRSGTGVNAALNDAGHTALHMAARTGDAMAVRKLLRVGAQPDQKDKEGQSALFAAIDAQSMETVELLTTAGADFSMRDKDGRAPLEWAIEKKCTLEFIMFLEQLSPHGAQKDAPTTALHAAALHDRADVITPLVARGHALNARDEDGNTPLMLAARAKSLHALNTLLDSGADPLVRNNDIETALHMAARHGDCAIMDRLLAQDEVRRAVNEHRTYRDGMSPLMEAADNNRADAATRLVQAGANVNQCDSRGRSALRIAVQGGHVEAASALVALGADIDKAPRKKDRLPPLVHDANGARCKDLLAVLHRAGADMNATDDSKNTALNAACEIADAARVRALLALGANPNISNAMGRRPIDTLMEHYSYGYSDHSDIISLLLRAGAQAGMAPSGDMRQAPLHMAAASGNVKSIDLLLKHRAKIDEPDKSAEGKTPLMEAAAFGQTRAATALMAQGANIAAKDTHGRTALHYAAAGGSEDLLKALLAQTGASLSLQDDNGMTLLHVAAQADRRPTMAFLIRQNPAALTVYDNDGMTPLHRALAETYNNDIFDVCKDVLGDKTPLNLKTRDSGETLLHIAARNGRQWSLDKLLAMGADVLAQDNAGLFPLEAALSTPHHGLTETLARKMKEAGFDAATYRDADGNSLLHRAAARGDDNAVDFLLRNGTADVNAHNAKGETPLLTALKAGKDEAARMLLILGADATAKDADGKTVLEIAAAGKNPLLIQDVILAVQMQQEEEARKREEEEQKALMKAQAEKRLQDEHARHAAKKIPLEQDNRPEIDRRADPAWHANRPASDPNKRLIAPQKPKLRLPPPGGKR